MTVRPEVVAYLQENLSKFPVEALRSQLYGEGVSDIDFQDCMAAAARAPKKKSKGSSKAAKVFLGAGLVLIVGAGLLTLSQKPPAPAPPPADDASSGESGFVGHRGWVVRLPRGYVGMSEFKDKSKSVELVHFCRKETDPTNFLNEGLFGQLGIVRLEVSPSLFAANPTGTASLSTAVTRKTNSHGEKFALKNIQIGTLSGVQVNILAPFPRIEAYILGQKELYFFYGGQEDEVWRDIVLSLRDARSEN